MGSENIREPWSTDRVLRAAEANVSLHGATDAEVETALGAATREIHRYVLERELSYRRRFRKQTSRTDGMTITPFFPKGSRRCPTKRELR